MEATSVTDLGGEQKFMSAKDAAEALGAHPNSLRRWAKAGVLPYYRTAGGQYRFDVGAYLARVLRDARA